MLGPMAQLTTRDGVRLFYERHGGGDAVVLLLMGLGMQGRVWGETAVRLEARGYVVVTMDNRGVGRSDTPWTPWTVGTMADDAVEVLDAVGAERAYVVGASLGGMIAQAVALRHAARVAGLALVSTTGGFPRMDYVPPAAVLGLLSLLVTRSRGGSPEARVRSTLKLITSERFADELDLNDPRLATMLAAMGDRLSPAGYLLQLLAAAAHATWGSLHKVTAPTLVQHGEADRVISAEAGRALAARIRSARLELYRDAGHVLGLQAPESMDRLGEFLDSAR
jgi:3-oxoadipate enol-lactonase